MSTEHLDVVIETKSVDLVVQIDSGTSAYEAWLSAQEAAASAAFAASAVSDMEAQVTAAAGSATAALASQNAAAASQATAAVSATAAAGSADTATAQATAAATSAASVNASFASFSKLWLGPHATDPTVDNQGNALQIGAIYENTSTSPPKIRMFTSAGWIDQDEAGEEASTNATLAATQAAASAASALVSQTAATTQATNSAASAVLAQKWAAQLTTAVDGTDFSAKQYALNAAASAAAASLFDPSNYVPRNTGGTYAARVGISYASPEFFINTIADGQRSNLSFYAMNVLRWAMGKSSASAAGANVGDDWVLEGHDDAGALIGSALSFVRSTLQATLFTRPLFGTSLAWDVGNLPMTVDVSGNMTAPANFTAAGSAITLKPAAAGNADLYVDTTGAAHTAVLHFFDNGNTRWALEKDASAETGTDSGSGMGLYTYLDDGTQKPVWSVLRATQKMDFQVVPSVAGSDVWTQSTLPFTVAGTAITAPGNVTGFSDERVKTNWRPMMDDFLERLVKVKRGTYDRTDIDLVQDGVSAQSLREAMPNCVIEDKDGRLSVAYGNAALVAVIELAEAFVDLRKLLLGDSK